MIYEYVQPTLTPQMCITQCQQVVLSGWYMHLVILSILWIGLCINSLIIYQHKQHVQYALLLSMGAFLMHLIYVLSHLTHNIILLS